MSLTPVLVSRALLKSNVPCTETLTDDARGQRSKGDKCLLLGADDARVLALWRGVRVAMGMMVTHFILQMALHIGVKGVVRRRKGRRTLSCWLFCAILHNNNNDNDNINNSNID